MPSLQLSLTNVGKRYQNRKILEGITIDLAAGDTLGIMGPSGVGKTTLARIIMGNITPDTGTIRWDGRDIKDKSVLRQNRHRVQMLVQDPTSALNPLKTVKTLLSEVPGINQQSHEHRDKTLSAILDQVGLSTAVLSYHPPELSGGMNQRVMLARLMLAAPDLIIFDEPTSGLDLSLQATILHLIKATQAQFGYTCLFISHHAEVVSFMCRRTIHLKGGRLEAENKKEEYYAVPH